MDITGRNIGSELLNVPMGEMTKSMGLAIAKAQSKLDQASVRMMQLMSGAEEEDQVLFGGEKCSLIELGFTPTFYQFVDTLIEVKLAITMTSSGEETKTTTSKTNTTKRENKQTLCSTVNGAYSSKYQYSVDGSSLLRTKLVPVPPPAILEERIRALLIASKTPAPSGGAGQPST